MLPRAWRSCKGKCAREYDNRQPFSCSCHQAACWLVKESPLLWQHPPAGARGATSSARRKHLPASDMAPAAAHNPARSERFQGTPVHCFMCQHPRQEPASAWSCGSGVDGSLRRLRTHGRGLVPRPWCRSTRGSQCVAVFMMHAGLRKQYGRCKGVWGSATHWTAAAAAGFMLHACCLQGQHPPALAAVSLWRGGGGGRGTPAGWCCCQAHPPASDVAAAGPMLGGFRARCADAPASNERPALGVAAAALRG